MIFTKELISEIHQVMVEMEYISVELKDNGIIAYKTLEGKWIDGRGYEIPT